MNGAGVKYRLSSYSILFTVAVSVILSVFFKWLHEGASINFMGGDARDYYSSLVSIFITGDFTNQQGSEWYLLKTSAGTVNVHPVGVSLLLLPFFLAGYAAALMFSFPADGYSVPFQLAVALAALTYAAVGLNFIKNIFREFRIRDSVTAILIVLIYFGTNLLHYTISEAGMSHVYSFALVSAFMYFSLLTVRNRKTRDLMASAILLGLILLVRPNNVFAVFIIFLWFRSAAECADFFRWLFRNRQFYLSLLLCLSIVSLQALTWYLQSGSFIQNTYKRDGFYWSDPQIVKMLFGFDGGFFIYTPLCIVLLFGLTSLYRRSVFAFVSAVVLLAVLFYFFSAYWAYTYFDGLGIRVLVDYYALFALFGGIMFEELFADTKAIAAALAVCGIAMLLNLVYTYQANRGIILRAGMNYEKFRYVFLRTSPEYADRLGGSSELVPFSSTHPAPLFEGSAQISGSYHFRGQEFGPAITVNRIGEESNRLHVALQCGWKEVSPGSSDQAQLCMHVEDPATKESRSYTQFRLNEVPAGDCCETIIRDYTANLVGDFKSGDRLSVYLWNIGKQEFLLEKLAIKVYNYSYQLN